MSHRSFIRKTISNVFYRFVYETERHNGIGELLEILGSIINGFAIPLKKEHLQFLKNALIPLHIPKCVTLYHQQLSYCIIQFVEKDPDTAIPILNGLIRYWPWSSSAKQVLMMNELEEILELLGHDQLMLVRDALFKLLATCLASEHFQVAERTLFLWNNDQLVNSGCLSKGHTAVLLPLIYGPLQNKAERHWNATVEVRARPHRHSLRAIDRPTSRVRRTTDRRRNRDETRTAFSVVVVSSSFWGRPRVPPPPPSSSPVRRHAHLRVRRRRAAMLSVSERRVVGRRVVRRVGTAT